ncbi:MAG: cyclic-di-AMP receptor [Butyricicoccus sp.]|nr:cyclic-di-AMP receptor [Butyricicoccus pullicaecorum]MCI6719329.1 cyclic-di-AMP receptor [Clostridiales bacterium]MDY5971345.1 cyclic-di-AMP receptor [Butyricicoccus sp.]
MKMLLAIINYDDAHNVINHLMKAGFQITKLATTGGFLRAGNVTILIGLDESRLDEAMELIRKYSNTRKQIIPTTANLGAGFHPAMPVEVQVGGATVFVLNVEKFEKL